MSGLLQNIIYKNEIVAVVIEDEATILDGLPDDGLRDVQAMCLYALEIHAGDRPGPYTDEQALAFATQVRAQRRVAEAFAARSN
jgi:hypothetical protein